jgi:hypothetical protein
MVRRSAKISTLLPMLLVFLVSSCSDGSGTSLGSGGDGGPGGGGTGGGNASVTVTISDPATCIAPQGPYSHIYMTVADVQANTSATALPGDSGWVDLTPDLAKNPVQIDMLGSGALQCSLPALASGTKIVAAAYQQFKVTLLDNAASIKPSGNQCGAAAANCVTIAANGSVQTIAITGEAQNGIIIPPSQINGGKFTLSVGDSKRLNVSVNSCSSVVVQSNGQFRLKPAMYAGEVGATPAGINGRVVDGLNQGVINGGRVVVALEQKDATGIDRVIQETTADSTGAFSFCSVPAGNYEVAAIAVSSLGGAYAATVAMAVPAGANLGNIPVFPQSGQVATVTGQVTTAGNSGAVSSDLGISALQSVTAGSATLAFTLPQLAPPSSTIPTATVTGSCPAGTACTNYTMTVPVQNPYTGTFGSNGTTYTQVTGNTPVVVDAVAFIAGSGNRSDCSPSELKSGSLALSAGVVTNVPALAFTGCQ